ncbi:MAG: cupin domain-containing protein [Candidatus Heimdallarchaeota archaeon]|nr:cupin domain-containing protein [Candidatus Heimdallarchaeota archaeon]
MPFIDLKAIQEKEVVPGFRGKFIHTENNTIVYWRIDAGSTLPEHKHPHEQTVNLIAGDFEFTLNGETKKIQPGTAVVVPSNAPHSGTAISDCFIIDIFYPVREEYR